MSAAEGNEVKKTVEQFACDRFNPLLKLDVDDQDNRLQDLQRLLHQVQIVTEAIYYERIDPIEAHAVMFFVAETLDHAKDTLVEDAVQFGLAHCRLLREGNLEQQLTANEGSEK